MVRGLFTLFDSAVELLLLLLVSGMDELLVSIENKTDIPHSRVTYTFTLRSIIVE